MSMTRKTIRSLPAHALFASALALVSFVATQAADEPSIEPIEIGFAERTGRSLMFIDVNAVDRDGRPLTGLVKEDFKLRIDYTWRAIYSVDDLCPCGEATPEPASDDPAAAARLAVAQTVPHFILYFDYSQLGQVGRAHAVYEAERWAREVMRDDDLAMVVAYGGDSVLRELTGFTGDRQAVLDAIQAGAADPELVDPFPNRGVQRQIMCDDGTVSCYHTGRQEYFHARRSLETLRNFLTDLNAIPARKTLLLFHQNASMFPGRLYGDGAAYVPQSSYDFWDAVRETGFSRARALRNNSELVPDLIELTGEVGGSATASRTVVYPLVCGGLRKWTVNFGANLADHTGGDYNHLGHGLDEVLDAAGRKCACIYRIGLEMKERKSSAVMRVKIRADGHSLPARYRMQYLTDGDRWMRKAQLVMAYPEGWSDLELQAAVVPVVARDGRWDVRVQIGLDLADLELAPSDDDGRDSVEWEAAALLSDESGRKHRELLGVYRARPGDDGRIDSLVLHDHRFDGLKPGHYELRAFVHDRFADRFGAVQLSIDLVSPEEQGRIETLVVRDATPHLRNALPLRDKGGVTTGIPAVETGPMPLGDPPRVTRGTALTFLTWDCRTGQRRYRSGIAAAGEPLDLGPVADGIDGTGQCNRIAETIDTAVLPPGRYLYEIAGRDDDVRSGATFEIDPPEEVTPAASH